MKVLVTGGNGFIGSNLIPALRGRGWEIAVLDRGLPRADIDWSGIDYLQGDFSDGNILCEGLNGCDLVFHLASTTVPATGNLNPEADVTGNLLGTMALIRSMQKSQIQRIVYLSSGGTVYGDCDRELVDEQAPCRPISSYGIVKYAIERYLLMFQRSSGLRPVILRASNPYGPRQGKNGIQGLIGTLISRIAANEAIDVWGDGSAVRDYIHVSDLVALMLKVAERDMPGIYNAGSGRGASVLEVISTVARAMNENAMVNFLPGREFDVRRIVLNSNLAAQCFDWQPTISLEDGVMETLSTTKSGAR